jgi:RimJ/RimL family protein N-acetyltransferase
MKFTLKNGKEIIIREVCLEDTQKILDYITIVNSETKNLSREPEEWNMTFENEQSFIKKVMNSKDEYMLSAWDEDLLISLAGFHGSSLQRIRHRSNLGISVLKEYHNLGLGTILMELLVQGAKDYGKRYLELEVRIDNQDAIHIYEKIGFVEEGKKKEAFFVDGKYVDLLLMAKKL